jgi:carbonic anhydrase
MTDKPIDHIETLIEGHKRFHRDIFPNKKAQYHLLAEMQAPEWLFITCSDSRIVPDLILQTGPGDLFITRNAGNVIPVAGADVDGCTATIEYAVEVLHVKHAIVCGHSDCGALKAALTRPDPAKHPKASRWLKHVEGAFTHKQPLNPADGEHAELASIIRGNVVAQLANLRAQPSVARAIAHHKIEVHGWYYDILTGRIEQYDEHQRKFLPLLG